MDSVIVKKLGLVGDHHFDNLISNLDLLVEIEHYFVDLVLQQVLEIINLTFV